MDVILSFFLALGALASGYAAHKNEATHEPAQFVYCKDGHDVCTDDEEVIVPDTLD